MQGLEEEGKQLPQFRRFRNAPSLPSSPFVFPKTELRERPGLSNYRLPREACDGL